MAGGAQERLARAVAGDETALADLLEEHGSELHRELEAQIAPCYRGLFDADDVMQVTYLEAFLRIRTFVYTGPNAFRGWLRRIAENNLHDAIRELERDKRPSPARRVTEPLDADSYAAFVERIAVTTTTASRAVAQQELTQLVETALAELPADYAEALRLYELQGLSGLEVAERMGRSHGAVRMLLARAREALAAVLGSQSRYL